jgi:hypothetical protein
MAIVSLVDSIKQTGWGDRKSELFIDGIMMSDAFLSKMTIIDGVKSKAQIPIYEASMQFGNDVCDVTAGGDGSYSISEKEVTNAPFTWYFSNCKTALEETYRSKMLRKGQLNEQTLDDEFKEWLFDYFAKRIGEKMMEQSYSELKTKILARKDSKVVGEATTCLSFTALTKDNILAKLEEAYKAFPDALLNTYMSQTDKDYAPTIYMNARTIQLYQLAMAEKYTTTPVGIIEGQIPSWMGFRVEIWSYLQDGEFVVCPPENFLIVTDDYGDVKAIQTEYEPKKNTEEFYGNFRIGFDFRRGDLIVAHLNTTSASSAKSTTTTTTSSK